MARRVRAGMECLWPSFQPTKVTSASSDRTIWLTGRAEISDAIAVPITENNPAAAAAPRIGAVLRITFLFLVDIPFLLFCMLASKIEPEKMARDPAGFLS
jgi:hypothetical protein